MTGGLGSNYDEINSVEEMEDALRNANWTVAEQPDAMKGCTAYTTRDIKGGHFGLLKIAELPDDTMITASDPKGTGKVSMVVSDGKGPEVEDTWLIVGNEEGHDVVFTFHPGEERVDILIRLCMVMGRCIDHPEYTAKIKVIPKKDYPVLMPCEF